MSFGCAGAKGVCGQLADEGDQGEDASVVENVCYPNVTIVTSSKRAVACMSWHLACFFSICGQ